MRRFVCLFVVGVGLALVGCTSSDLKRDVVGDWKYDVPSMVLPGVGSEYTHSPEFANLWAPGHLEIKADGTYDRSDSMESYKGKWALDGRTIKLTSETPTDPMTPTFEISASGSKIHGTLKLNGQTGTFEMLKE